MTNLSLPLLALGKTAHFRLVASIKPEKEKPFSTIRSFPSHTSVFSAPLSKGMMRNGHELQPAVWCHAGGCVRTGMTGQQGVLALPEPAGSRRTLHRVLLAHFLKSLLTPLVLLTHCFFRLPLLLIGKNFINVSGRNQDAFSHGFQPC